MTQPSYAEDYFAISRVKAQYCRFVDSKDWAGYTGLFTEDAEFDCEPGNPPMIGRDAFVAHIRTYIEPAQTAHHVHSPEIDVDGDVAHVVWAMQDRVIGAAHLEEKAHTGFGHYRERYVRQDGHWRIASMQLRYVVYEAE